MKSQKAFRTGEASGSLQPPVNVRGEEELSKLANPQLFLYFGALFAISNLFSFLLSVTPSLLRNHKQSPFEAHRGIFVIITFVAFTVAVLASCVLIFTSQYMKSWMKDIHYTILKSIGCFSALLTPFSLGALLFLPHNTNWIFYSLICFVVVCILWACHFLYANVCAHRQDKRFNEFPVHWTTFLLALAPLSFASKSFISSNLVWIPYLVFLSVSLYAAGNFIFRRSFKPNFNRINHPMVPNKSINHPMVPNKTINHPMVRCKNQKQDNKSINHPLVPCKNQRKDSK